MVLGVLVWVGCGGGCLLVGVAVEIVLSDDEKRILKDYKRFGYVTIQRKAEAILLCAGGVGVDIVADFVDRSEITLNRWLAAFRRIRLASIYTEHLGNTNASKLTEEQRQRLNQVLSDPPSKQGIPATFWSVPAVKQWVVSEFDVIYASDQSYHLLLKHVGLRFRYPQTVDQRRGNGQKITERMEEIRKEIAPRLTDPDQVVVAADEVRLEHEAITRKSLGAHR